MQSNEKVQFLAVLSPQGALQDAMARCSIVGASPEVDAQETKAATRRLEAVLEYPEITKFVIDASALGATVYGGDIHEFMARYTVACLVVASRKGLITLER